MIEDDDKLIEAMVAAGVAESGVVFGGMTTSRRRAVMRAALAVVRHAEGWRPASEMPDDGRDVIMYSKERGMAIWPSTARWNDITDWRDAPAAPADD